MKVHRKINTQVVEVQIFPLLHFTTDLGALEGCKCGMKWKNLLQSPDVNVSNALEHILATGLRSSEGVNIRCTAVVVVLAMWRGSFAGNTLSQSLVGC